ncbi:MAG: hypothetical protein CL923_06895 [Deltaproteobacteria bacterium]|nr:hypothetical protein [Deltaproteobacteria bacterium]
MKVWVKERPIQNHGYAWTRQAKSLEDTKENREGEVNEPLGKRIVGILTADPALGQNAEARLPGSVERRSPEYPFTQTRYYEAEMGSNLRRWFVSLSGLLPLSQAAVWKQELQALEERWRVEGRRPVNLDAGYLDLHRVVLLSHKAGAQKLYLSGGVWADLVLQKSRGGYTPFPWTFPDLKTGQYNDFLLGVRADYKRQLREFHAECNGFCPAP